jgi:hypothetical protein
MGEMEDTLTDVVIRIKESTDSIVVSAKQISAGNQDLSSRTVRRRPPRRCRSRPTACHRSSAASKSTTTSLIIRPRSSTWWLCASTLGLLCNRGSRKRPLQRPSASHRQVQALRPAPGTGKPSRCLAQIGPARLPERRDT